MPNELSGGMRKRAGFARALVLDPEIVLFDEPDSGLDPVRTALLCELIKEVHAENGGCYVVITHDIMSARRVAEHISVLWKGRIVESGPGRRAVRVREPVRAPVPLRRIGRAPRHGVSRRGVTPTRSGALGRLAFVCERRAVSRPSRAAPRAGRGSCSRSRSCSGWAARRSRCACARRRRRARSCRARAPSTRRRSASTRSFGEEPIEVLVKGNLQQLVLSSDIERLVGLEGCLSGNVPASALAAEGGVNGPCGQLARARTVKVVLRAGDVRQRGGRPDRRTARRPRPSRPKPRPSRPNRRSTSAALARGLPAQRGARARPPGEQDHDRRASRRASRRSRSQYGLTARPSIEDRELRLDARVRLDQAGGHAEAALRLPVPEPRRRARLGADAGGAVGSRSGRARSALIRQAVGDAASGGCSTARRYLVTGEPVIVADLNELDHALDRAAADRRAARDGRRRSAWSSPGARGCCRSRWRCSPPRSPSARCRSSGASLTMASIAVLPVLVGPRGRLRDPVPVARRGGPRAEAASTARPRASARCARGGRARAARRSPPRPRPAPRRCSCCCSRRCRWCAASACCWWWAWRSRCCARSPRAPRRSRCVVGQRGAALGAGAARSARAACGAARGAPARALGRLARRARAACATTRSPGRVAARRSVGAVRRPGRVLGVGLALAALGLGPGHADEGRDRHHQARAAEPRLAAEPQHARAHHRRRRRDRPDGRRARTSPSPATIEWMSSLRERGARSASATAPRSGCGKARLCPAFSLPDLFERPGRRRAPGVAAQALPARGQRAARRDPARTSPRT